MKGLIGIYNENGDKLSVESLKLFGLKLHIPSPSYDLITESVDGRGGVIVLDEILQPRNLTARFFTNSGNYEDTLRLRDELYRILSSGGAIYVSETYQPGKRWMVHVQGWSPERINRRVLEFEIPLINPIGLSESVNIITRSFDTTTFAIHNDGDVAVDMKAQEETTITFVGESDSLAIHNLTTGDLWTYDGTSSVDDVITLKGVRSFKNGQSIFGETNHKLISLAVGNNNFEISGASGPFTLTISTRFYFL